MSFYRNAGGIAQPTTRDELVNEIKFRLDRGQTNLNDIDTSRITDMSDLFYDFKQIQNIDISLWDVSNVRDMSYMFFSYKNFNCDLSKWNPKKLRFYNLQNLFHNSGIKKIPKWYDTRSTPGVL